MIRDDWEHQFEDDFTHMGNSLINNVLSTTESPVPDKTGCIDTAESGYVASCGGYMGNEQLVQFHYVWTVEDGRKWLVEHGCTKIVDITESK